MNDLSSCNDQRALQLSKSQAGLFLILIQIVGDESRPSYPQSIELFILFPQMEERRKEQIASVCRWFRFAQLAKGKKFRP
jgi:hypothetical protein